MKSDQKNQNGEKPQEVELNQFGRPKQAVVLYELTPEMVQQAAEAIEKDDTILPEKSYQQAREKSGKIWDKFYSNHKCNFFKDRNYLERQIKEITYFKQKHQVDKKQYIFMEMGCGVGNTIFPLLREYAFFNYLGCDISATAIELIEKQMKVHPQYEGRLQVKVCDLVKDHIPFEQKPDLISMIFVLSAIVPEKHCEVIKKIAEWMKPGSFFYFRDYGRYDFGQINMSNKKNRKLANNFYVKHDGVCVYYFDQKQLEKIFEDAGLVKIEGSIHCRLLENRKTGLKMYRVWVQGRFYKPPICDFFKERIEKEQKEQNEKNEKEEKEEKNEKQKQIENGLEKNEIAEKKEDISKQLLLGQPSNKKQQEKEQKEPKIEQEENNEKSKNTEKVQND